MVRLQGDEMDGWTSRYDGAHRLRLAYILSGVADKRESGRQDLSRLMIITVYVHAQHPTCDNRYEKG